MSKSYDSKGRVTEDIVYKGEGKMTGKYFQYKDEDYGVGYNSITEMKDGEPVYAKVFESDTNPMGYESFYKNGSEAETKYYGKNGKLLGSRKMDADGKVKGIEVAFGYEPFRI